MGKGKHWEKQIMGDDDDPLETADTHQVSDIPGRKKEVGTLQEGDLHSLHDIFTRQHIMPSVDISLNFAAKRKYRHQT